MNPIRPVCGGTVPGPGVPGSNRGDATFGRILGALGPGSGQAISAPLGADRVDAMLLHQLRHDEEARRNRRQLRRGQDMLALLARMQRDLLDGECMPSEDRTTDELLTAALEPLADAADAALGGIVQAIALRLKVELARRGSKAP